MLPSDKEIVLEVGVEGVSASVLKEAKSVGIKRLLTKAPPPSISADGFSVLTVSDQAGEDKASWVRIDGAGDLDRAVSASSRKQAFVVVECSDWTIIPLENLIAEFRRRGRRLYAFASSKEGIETALGVLEKGVDGVVIPPGSLESAKAVSSSMDHTLPMEAARITRILDAGLGDRACVDTTSQLAPGEGMLVGSRASFFFLVHGETLPSQYIPTRPFRVNAGALHGYVLSSDGKTRYLSEFEPPDKVTIVGSRGETRPASVGRVKIERRPLVMIEAAVNGASGSVILQKAETIRLVRGDGTAVSVTELKAGDEVIVHTESVRARHFGGEVDEHIEEK